MIVKIDHLATTSQDIILDRSKWEEQGYTLHFCEFNKVNIEIKKPLLSVYHDVHDLALMSRDGAYAIELINHHNVNDRLGAYSLECYQANGFMNCISISVPDMAQALKFWQLFGFQILQQGLHEVCLVFTDLFSRTGLYLRLFHSDTRKFFSLDDAGFTCLAFVSNSIEKDLTVFSEAGYDVTEIEPLEINKRMLRIAFMRGACGELVELVEVTSRSD